MIVIKVRVLEFDVIFTLSCYLGWVCVVVSKLTSGGYFLKELAS